MSRSIAENIEHFREQIGISKGEIARRMGYRTVAMVVHWTSGRRLPDTESLSKLAAILKTTPSKLDPDGTAPQPRRSSSAGIQKKGVQSDNTLATAPESLDQLGRAMVRDLEDPVIQEVIAVFKQISPERRHDAIEGLRAVRDGIGVKRNKQAGKP